MNRMQPKKTVGIDLETRLKTIEDNIDYIMRALNKPQKATNQNQTQGAGESSVIIKVSSLISSLGGAFIPIVQVDPPAHPNGVRLFIRAADPKGYARGIWPDGDTTLSAPFGPNI